LGASTSYGIERDEHRDHLSGTRGSSERKSGAGVFSSTPEGKLSEKKENVSKISNAEPKGR